MAIAWDKNSKSFKKIKNRYKNERLKHFNNINQAHKLALPQEWLEQEAEAYGDYKASSETFLFSELDPFDMVVMAVGLIITIVVTIKLPATAAFADKLWFKILAGIGIAAEVGGIALTMAKQGFLDQVGEFTKAQTQNTNLQKNLTQNALQSQSRQLTDFLINDPYAICATGYIYKHGEAGSESFNYTKAYDPTQGLRGDFHSSPIDDTLQNRAHKTLAGNSTYDNMQNPLPIPKAKALLDFSQEQQGIRLSMQNANEDINEGYMKLSKEDFGYFENGKHLEKYYKHSHKTRIEPLKNRHRINDFLEKQKNYAKGLRANFFYEYLKEKHLTLEQRQKNLGETLQYYKEKLEAQANDKIEQGAIFLDLATYFIQSFYDILRDQSARDIRGNSHDDTAYQNKSTAENIFNGWHGNDAPFFDRSAYFLNGKTIGLPPANYGYADERLYTTFKFADEPFAKAKLALDFYTLGWREILYEFDEIYNNLLRKSYTFDNKHQVSYALALVHRQRAYWVAGWFIVDIHDDKEFTYLVEYHIDTPTIELFLNTRSKRPQLEPNEWEQAYNKYIGAEQ